MCTDLFFTFSIFFFFLHFMSFISLGDKLDLLEPHRYKVHNLNILTGLRPVSRSF